MSCTFLTINDVIFNTSKIIYIKTVNTPSSATPHQLLVQLENERVELNFDTEKELIAGFVQLEQLLGAATFKD